MAENFQIRELINAETVAQIGSDIKRAWPAFDEEGFKSALLPIDPEVSIKARGELIAAQLAVFLPEPYPEAIAILQRSFGPEIGDPDVEGGGSFYYLAHSAFVRAYGLAPEDYEVSMKAVYEITKRFTSEWAIRAFLIAYPEKTLERLSVWVKDPNLHVRRLVSEGIRPRLPWAERLKMFQADPKPVLQLLEHLKADPVQYVRRSVANNLNDIAKDYPDLVVTTLEKWQKNGDPGTQWIIRHALRSLVKAGHRGALNLLGFRQDVNIAVKNLQLNTDRLMIGKSLSFSFDVHSEEAENCPLMVDFIIHFLKANGQLAPKVFKLTQKELVAGKTMTFSKAHSFKRINTRKYYPGRHALEVQINGKGYGLHYFELVEESS